MKMDALIVVAHPDDEVIFFWWALQHPGLRCSILCCSSDANNPARKKWARRKDGLFALGSNLNIPVTCLDYNSEFYKTDGRSGEAALFADHVMSRIRATPHDVIITHNAWGEYGHLDHIRINQIVGCMGQSVQHCDTFLPSEWMPSGTSEPQQEGLRKCFINDMPHYERCKKNYTDIRCWTWDRGPITTCSTI